MSDVNSGTGRRTGTRRGLPRSASRDDGPDASLLAMTISKVSAGRVWAARPTEGAENEVPLAVHRHDHRARRNGGHAVRVRAPRTAAPPAGRATPGRWPGRSWPRRRRPVQLHRLPPRGRRGARPRHRPRPRRRSTTPPCSRATSSAASPPSTTAPVSARSRCRPCRSARTTPSGSRSSARAATRAASTRCSPTTGSAPARSPAPSSAPPAAPGPCSREGFRSPRPLVLRPLRRLRPPPPGSGPRSGPAPGRKGRRGPPPAPPS